MFPVELIFLGDSPFQLSAAEHIEKEYHYRDYADSRKYSSDFHVYFPAQRRTLPPTTVITGFIFRISSGTIFSKSLA